ILYINFGGAAIHGGIDCSDAPTNCSSLVGSSGVVGYPPFSGSATTEQQIVAEVSQMYAAYNVQIVTSRPPPSTHYSMTMVGGNGTVLGVPAGWVGVAPIDCTNQNDNDISFVFAAQLGSPHDIAVTIAQESGHGFGLAHTNDQGDVM